MQDSKDRIIGLRKQRRNRTTLDTGQLIRLRRAIAYASQMTQGSQGHLFISISLASLIIDDDDDDDDDDDGGGGGGDDDDDDDDDNDDDGNDEDISYVLWQTAAEYEILSSKI